MGRTLPTFNLYLEREQAAWLPFRRALRREDRAAFDRLFALAKRHMAEAMYVARPVPFDTLILTILLEQQKELERLRQRLDGETEGGESPAASTDAEP